MNAGVVMLVALALLLGRGLREATRGSQLGPRAPAVNDRTAVVDMSLALRGLVLDERGVPVAGASVAALLERPEATERVQGETRADGGFALRVADASATYRLQVVADGYFAALVDALLPGAEALEVKLRAAPSLKGTVLTTAGTRIAGARVRLLAHTKFGEPLAVEATSDASGRYVLSGGLLDLEHLASPLLEASAAGFAPTRVKLHDFAALLAWRPALDELVRDIVLARGHRLTGHVRDELGAPVAGAELVVFTHAGRGEMTDPYGIKRSTGLGPTAIATTVSSEDGRFVLEGLPVRSLEECPGHGPYGMDGEEPMGSVRVRAEGFALGGAHLPWTKESEPSPPLELVLLRSAAFTGRAVDGQGRALAGAQVIAHIYDSQVETIVPYGEYPDGFGELMFWPRSQEHGSSRLWFRTGVDGRFRSHALPCLPPGKARVRLGLAWHGVYGGWQELELHAGELRELGDVALALNEVSVPIEGVVQGPDGGPIAGAEVRLQDHWMIRTDRGGRFRFEHAVLREEAFASLDFRVAARGFARHQQILTGRPQGPLEIRLAKGLELRGRLTFRNGMPAANGKIGLERPWEPGQGFWWSDSIAPTRTDADGRFAFTDLPEPPWGVSYGLSRPGVSLHGDTLAREPHMDLALELPRNLSEFASLEVGVTDVGGRPVAVERAPELHGGPARTPAGLRRDARTFVFPEMAPGRYVLKLEAPGSVPHEQEVELELGGSARVDVVLQVVTYVRVRVWPLPLDAMQFRVVAESSTHATWNAAVGDDGVADLGVLRHGTWTIWLEAYGAAGGGRPWRGPTRTIDVAVGESSLEWTLERPALGRVRLALPVHGASDQPIPSDDPSSTDGSPRALSSLRQAWWKAHRHSFQRARELNVELRDDSDVVLLDMVFEDVDLDAVRNRVCSTFTAPVGRYTLVLRRGAEVLRRAPIQVLPDTTIDLDP